MTNPTDARTSRIAWGEPAVLVYLVLGALLMVAVTGTMADPDLWGHLRFGRDIVVSGTVPRSDAYSFTSDQPWINHEWLAEVLMYGAFAAGGVAGLLVFKAALVMTILIVIFCSLRRFDPPAEAYAAVGVVTVAGILLRIQTVRPQLFSLLLFAVLLFILSEADRGRIRGLIALPAIMAAWVNLHGGWLVGIGVAETWLVLAILERDQDWRRRGVLCLTAVGAPLATLANPYGPRMWAFLWTTVGPARPDILEWASIPTIPLGAAIPWLVSVAAAAFVLVKSRQPWQRCRARALVLVTLLGAASFRVNRLDAFLTVAVVVLLAPEFARLCSMRPTFRRRSGPTMHRYAAIGVTFMVAIAMSVIAGPIVFAQLRCLESNAVSTPDSEAVDFIEANHLNGKLLNWFDWGEYIIWRFGPTLKVSIDGRRETVYSDRLLTAHYRFYRNEADAEDLAAGIRPDYIWLPKRFPIVETLRRRGWQAVFDGSSSVVLAKPTDHRVEFAQVFRAPSTAQCFPDS